ncbi:MAG: hypothetical protein RL189_8 [Pseudomonadota bacterium]
MATPPLAILRLCAIVLLTLLLTVLLPVTPTSLRTRTKLTSRFFALLLRCCGIRVECNLPDAELQRFERAIVVANHVSYLDILILSTLRPCIFLAKKEVADWPLFGWAARALGCIFVRRESLMGRAHALRECLRMSPTADIALFPEGTTTSSRLPELTAWARGHAWIALRGQVDAILCLRLSYENHSERAWIDDQSLVPHLLKTLSEKSVRVAVSGAWVAVHPSAQPAELAINTYENVCMAVSYDSP